MIAWLMHFGYLSSTNDASVFKIFSENILFLIFCILYFRSIFLFFVSIQYIRLATKMKGLLQTNFIVVGYLSVCLKVVGVLLLLLQKLTKQQIIVLK